MAYFNLSKLYPVVLHLYYNVLFLAVYTVLHRTHSECVSSNLDAFYKGCYVAIYHDHRNASF